MQHAIERGERPGESFIDVDGKKLLLVSFCINENVDTVNGYKHRINSSTQVFLQYICNWCEDATLCASPHLRLNR